MPRSPLNHPLIITQSFMANPATYPGTKGHPGVDLRSPLRDDWFACVPGTVTLRTDWGIILKPFPHVGLVGYGRAVELDWGQADGTFIKFLYGHGTNRLSFPPGQNHVEEGKFLAESGNTGRSTAPHLHFEMRRYYRPGTGHGRLYDKRLNLTYNLLDPVAEFLKPNGIPFVHV